MNRPPLSAWMLADILAISAGCRYELASTLWPRQDVRDPRRQPGQLRPRLDPVAVALHEVVGDPDRIEDPAGDDHQAVEVRGEGRRVHPAHLPVAGRHREPELDHPAVRASTAGTTSPISRSMVSRS